MNFTKLTNQFETLKNISSSNEKKDYLKSILVDDIDAEETKGFFKWLYDTSVVTGISEKKFNKKFDMFDYWTIEGTNDISLVCQYLLNHKTGKDEDIMFVQSSMDSICKDDKEKEFYKNVVTKNVVVGIDKKLINKVVPNLIPSFDVMLANRWLELTEEQINKLTKNHTREFVIEEKLDGFRCIAIKENGNVKLVSRQGKLFEGLVDIENDVKSIPDDNFILDGELLITDRDNIESKNQYKATSKIVSSKDMEKHGISLNVFDYLPLDQWNTKKCTLTYSDRYNWLEQKLVQPRLDLNGNSENNNDNYRNLHLVPIIYKGIDVSQVTKNLDMARKLDWEGVMVRFSDSMYEFKRSNDLLKVKQMNEMDAYIIGYNEGINRNKGKLGNFVCEIDHPKFGYLKFECGSGYSDEERENYWQIKDELIGRVMEVQYFEVTENTTTHIKSVRFPVHKCIKEIGQEPNN